MKHARDWSQIEIDSSVDCENMISIIILDFCKDPWSLLVVLENSV